MKVCTDIWFQYDFWEASSRCFQSSFSTAWCPCWGSPGKYSMIDYFLGDAFGVLSCLFWNTALRCGALLAIHTLNYWTASSVVYLNVTLHIVDLWQYYVCCKRSGVTRCTLFKLWCSSWAVCAGAGYARRCDRTSVHLCAWSLQNLAV